MSFEHPELQAALAVNRAKLIISPYYATCLRHLPIDEKQKYETLDSTKLPSALAVTEQIHYAAGILMNENLPEEIFEYILNFLPLMGTNSVNKMREKIFKKHPDGIVQIAKDEMEVTDELEEPKGQRAERCVMK